MEFELYGCTNEAAKLEIITCSQMFHWIRQMAMACHVVWQAVINDQENIESNYSIESIDPLNERTEGVHTRVLELGSIEDFGGVC